MNTQPFLNATLLVFHINQGVKVEIHHNRYILQTVYFKAILLKIGNELGH